MICPGCGKEVDANGGRCPHCGAVLSNGSSVPFAGNQRRGFQKRSAAQKQTPAPAQAEEKTPVAVAPPSEEPISEISSPQEPAKPVEIPAVKEEPTKKSIFGRSKKEEASSEKQKKSILGRKKKKEFVQEETDTEDLGEVYDPNADGYYSEGYYDQALPELSSEINKIPTENKMRLVIIAVVILAIVAILFFSKG